MFVLPHAEQRGAPQRAQAQIEWTTYFVAQRLPQTRVALDFGNREQVINSHVERGWRTDDLNGPILVMTEDGPQNLVPARDFLEGRDHHGHLKISSHPQDQGLVVCGLVCFELVDEPDPLLRRRQGSSIHIIVVYH